MKGIRTPDPVAYIEEKKMGLIHYSFYISVFENEFTHIRKQMLLEPWNKPFQKELALFIAELHRQGILFLDLSPGNILCQEKDNQLVFSLVDINRMKFKANLSLKERYKNFMRLSGNLEIMTGLAREYATACSLNEKETINQIIGYCTTFNKKKWFRKLFLATT
jgi:serine/threonine protein kinase